MATAEGMTQAMFPEGGLSLDGRVGAAKMGLLSYIAGAYTPDGRDVVFVPVGLAYDRVLEDRILVQANAEGVRRFRASPLSIAGFVLRNIGRKLRGRFRGFGTAAAGFGPPQSLRAFYAQHPGASIEDLGRHLMLQIEQVVPVTPVALIAAGLANGPRDRADLLAGITAISERLRAAGAVLKLPPQGLQAALDEGLAPLQARGLVGTDLKPMAGSEPVVAYYAAGILQRLSDGV